MPRVPSSSFLRLSPWLCVAGLLLAAPAVARPDDDGDRRQRRAELREQLSAERERWRAEGPRRGDGPGWGAPGRGDGAARGYAPPRAPGYGPPGYGAPPAYAPPPAYRQPPTYVPPPPSYRAPPTYVPPPSYAPPPSYGAPPGYGVPRGYGAPPGYRPPPGPGFAPDGRGAGRLSPEERRTLREELRERRR